MVCGGGPAGSLMAVYLAGLGYEVDVCEQRAMPDPLGRNLDRSYHLAMSHRGMGAVERVCSMAAPRTVPGSFSQSLCCFKSLFRITGLANCA